MCVPGPVPFALLACLLSRVASSPSYMLSGGPVALACFDRRSKSFSRSLVFLLFSLLSGREVHFKPARVRLKGGTSPALAHFLFSPHLVNACERYMHLHFQYKGNSLHGKSGWPVGISSRLTETRPCPEDSGVVVFLKQESGPLTIDAH